MSYYGKTIYIPGVDREDQVTGRIERHRAHREALLHRAFTVAVYYDDRIVCQHRRHPVFDAVLDLTASSHPYYEGEELIDCASMILPTLRREWSFVDDLVGAARLLGKVHYKEHDGEWWEHEICELYAVDSKHLPAVNYEYAYGMSLLSPGELRRQKHLAPWVRAFLEEGLL